jgi:glycine oxidase
VSLPRTTDVLVIGAGVIGCAVARELVGGGRSIVVVDRGAVGGEASSAAAGVLSVASGDDEGARLALRRASRALVPELAAALHDETAIDVGFRRCGILALAWTDAEMAEQTARAAARRAQGFAAEVVDAAYLHELEPAASPSARGAAFFADDAVVAADRLVAALAASARRRGVTIVPGAPALAAERATDRVLRVRVGAEWIATGAVVLATGAWSGEAVAGLDVGVDVVPVRGQMLALRPSRPLAHVVTAGDGFVVPRAHGEVWVGATFEEVGFTKAVTPDGLRRLGDHVVRLAPALRDAPVARAWAGLRPFHRRGGPAIGRAPGWTNVFVATGHHRNGVLLAAITGRAMRAWLDGTAPPEGSAAFVP